MLMPMERTEQPAEEAEKLREIKEQCEWVQANVNGIEARTLATIILGLIDPEEDIDD